MICLFFLCPEVHVNSFLPSSLPVPKAAFGKRVLLWDELLEALAGGCFALTSGYQLAQIGMVKDSWVLGSLMLALLPVNPLPTFSLELLFGWLPLADFN